MHYSLTNAPATFQQFMNDIFKDLLDVCVVVYLDDILIYSEDQSEHEKHVCQVLQQLQDNNLFAKLEKCEFNVNTTNFLGYIISPEGLCIVIKCRMNHCELLVGEHREWC